MKNKTVPTKKRNTKIAVKGQSRSALSGKIMGVTSDGIVIYEPNLNPQTFTKTELRRAVRAVKAERALHAS